ncbi:MFS transporter [Chloroflexota bacterium]
MANREIQQIPRGQPRFYYGWIVLVACLIIVVTATGIRFSFGVFFKPLEADFELSRALTSQIFSVHMVVGSLFTILAGWALDRYKPKILFITMGLLTGFSLLLTSQASELWHVYVSYSLLFAIGSGPVWILASSIALRWFAKERGLASGIVTSGMGIGLMVMTPLSAWLIAGYGWQTSFFILALLAFIIIIPCAFLLKGAPYENIASPNSVKMSISRSNAPEKEHYGEKEDLSLLQAVRTSTFWLLFFVPFLMACCIFIVFTHIVPHATDLGITPIRAASILSIVGGTEILGRLLMGKASDSIGRKRTIMICVFLTAGAMLLLVWASSLWMFYLFAFMFGFSYGGVAPSFYALIGDFFGMRHIGVIMAVINSTWGIGGAVGPMLAGYIYDVSSSYGLAFVTGTLALLLIAGLVYMLRIPKIKI